ncbi:MAG TPA: radical SAM protein [Xanthobacteraceae bacterium]|nr:radical SAM protein [Xanthobacteraceae bacterium]
MAAVTARSARQKFCLVMVKPSHYDDDGYVIQFLRSAVPSNSLAALYGLAKDCADRRALGEDVEIEIHALDETNTRIRPARLAGLIEAAGHGMVMLVGVQSIQFPRALDIARPLRERGIQVAVGGFHVSGTIAMLDERDSDVRRAEEMGVALFAGEAEDRLDAVLRDALSGRLKPLYNFMDDLPGIDGAPTPILPAARVNRTIGGLTSFDAGRGCPYQCSFCTIINVQGRKSRRRTADDVERIVRANLAQGIHTFFITDDNFARNKDWEPILDRLIHLREVEKLKMSFVIQVDTLCHRIPNFIEKCGRAGVRRVFIGLENINPANLLAAKKRQNKITEYRRMLLAWKSIGALTCGGYILGFPHDTLESIRHDMEVIKNELPIDLLEFFNLTPLPGSEDHQKMHRARVPMDPDMNNYDGIHVTMGHPLMSREEWGRAHLLAWDTYYSLDHAATVMRRAIATGVNASNNLSMFTWFKGCIHIEGIHPLEGGFIRLKSRRDRRPGRAIEPIWRFYPKVWAETVWKLYRWISLYAKLRKIYLKVKHDPRRHDYMDAALSPIADDEIETHELFKTDAARAYVAQERRLEKLREGQAA